MRTVRILACLLFLAHVAGCAAPLEPVELRAQKGAQQDGDDGEGDTPKISQRVVLPRDRHPLFLELTLANEDPNTPMLVLFHEARSSLGEYRPIVPRLKELGYNALSVDLTCGVECRGRRNVSARKNGRAGAKSTYLDVLPEMLDTILWAREHHAHGKLVAWGSGFTASLVIVMGVEHPDLVDGVVCFAPGEFFGPLGKSATWIQEQAREFQGPAFFAPGARDEAEWKAIYDALPTTEKTVYLPAGEPVRGSKALWPESPGNAEAWAAVEAFLRARFPVPAPTPR